MDMPKATNAATETMNKEKPHPLPQDVPLPIFVYSKNYNIDLGAHVFPAIKYGLIYQSLKENKLFDRHSFLPASLVSRESASLVHSEDYLNDLMNLEMTRKLYRSELPLTQEVVTAFFLSSGGTLLAAEQALEKKKAINLGGGFHHSFPDRAEGFCYLNDVAIAIRKLQKEKKVEKVLIIDLDVHQGNGTANTFQKDSSVFTFSMHEQNNYPLKETSTLDIGLATGLGDKEYLAQLKGALEKIQQQFQPDLIFYLAGVDVYREDRLGGLKMTFDGIRQRDEMVRDFAASIPLAVTLAGGYALNDQDTISLHLQTCKVMTESSATIKEED